MTSGTGAEERHEVLHELWDRARRGSPLLWAGLGALVVAAIALGVYFGVLRDTGGSARIAADPGTSGSSAMFRGDPAHSGTYPDRGAAVTGRLAWKSDTGDSLDSSPAVSDGVVFVGSKYRYSFERKGRGYLYAFDAATGTERWKFETGDSVYSSPAVSGGLVYVGSADGRFYALDTATGAQRWKRKTGEVVSAPTVSGGMVYVASNNGSLYALDAASGAQRWRFKAVGLGGSSPAVSGGLVYVGAESSRESSESTEDDYGYLYAVDAATGAERWKFRTGGWVDSSPAVAGGLVYFGSQDGYLYALDAAGGAERWKFKTEGVVWSSPAVSGGVVYTGVNGVPPSDQTGEAPPDGYLYALDATSGAELWKFEAGDWVDSSPAVCDGVVYVGNCDGYLYALDAASGAERWKFKTGGAVRSSPVVSGGLVYVGSEDGCLYAVK